MILQSLAQLYDRLADDPAYEIAPFGFSPQKISFRVVLRPDGSLFAIEDARKPDDRGRLQTDVLLVPGEAKPPGAGINPCFLWDNQTYLLGRQPDDKRDDFGLKRFEAFRAKHLTLEREINDPSFRAVCRFLEHWDPSQIANHPLLEEVGTGFGVFMIHGEKRPVHENRPIQEWWRTTQKTESADESIVTSQCLITGEVAPIARLHPKIKNISGAQPAGANLVSFEAQSYRSYGKLQSFNAPVSEDAAFRYGTALNSLVDGPQAHKHCLRIGNTTVAFWTDKPSIVEDCLADLFGAGSAAPDESQDISRREQLQRLLEAIRTGGRFQEDSPGDTAFYILGLAPNAARLAIRFFHRSTTAVLLERLHRHHHDFNLVRPPHNPKSPFANPEFPAIRQILRETAREADDIPPILSGALTRSIVEGLPYPEGLFAAVVRRIHADRNINYLRAATIKAVLVRNFQQPIATMLDPTNHHPAYLLGRLFAVLEKTQEDALGDLNSGLRDKFYASASATPAAVFPRIIRTFQHHLGKLSSYARVNRERLVQEILSSIESSGFPSQFPLKSQGIFAIGYYHQRRDFFTKKEAGESTTTATSES